MKRALQSLAMAAALATSAPSMAAQGDTLVYRFDTTATGNATPTVNQATLTLTETATGVNFTLTPDWTVTGNRVDQIVFAYSGEALTFVDGAGPNGAFSTGTGALDAGYNSVSYVTIDFPSAAANRFDSGSDSASWSLEGSTITLADFQTLATTNSTKPDDVFGVLSVPGVAGSSNWVAGAGTITTAVPEPQTYALMLAGLGIVAFASRRRARRDGASAA